MATIDVEVDEAVYPVDCLNAAAYRMIGTATCQIDKMGSKYVCRLSSTASDIDPDELRHRFLDLVTDECLRERLSVKTEPVRNLILSLAFGALASEAPE